MKIQHHILPLVWAACLGTAICPIDSALAVSPSVSPWETILSVDTPAGAEEDHNPEAIASGQTIHTVWTSNVGYDLQRLCYRRSLDGGATWQSRVVLQDYGNDTRPMMSGNATRLAVDGDNVHIVQTRFVGGWHHEIDYYRSTDGGATFEPARTILRGPDGWNVDGTRITAAGEKIAVAYGLSQNWGVHPTGNVLLSADNGDSFGAHQVVSDAYGPYDWNWGSVSCLDIQWAGDRMVSLWQTNGSVRCLSAASNTAGTSVDTVALSTEQTTMWGVADGMHPRLCAVAGNMVHMVWNQRNASGRSAVFYARSGDGGVTYETTRDLSEGTIGTEEVRGGRVTVQAQGNHVYLCYVANGSGGVWLRSSDDFGATFGAAVPLHIPGSSLLGNGEFPCLALDPNDPKGYTVWFAFAVPSAYSGCSASVLGRTLDGGASIESRLMPAHPWAWGNGHPSNFLLVPASGPDGTGWTMLYVGSRPGYDGDLFARQLTPGAAAGASNKVLHFEGSATTQIYDMAEVPSAQALQFSDSLTVEMWVRVAPGARMERGLEILQWGRGDDALAFRAYASGSGNHTVSGRFRTTAGNYGIGGAPITGDGAWHHLAMTYDANAGPFNLRFFVDGHLYHSVTATGMFIPAPEPVIVGGISSGLGLDPLNGDVDNLRLWNRPLSENEIRESARQADLTGSETGLAAAFSFDGTMNDLSGNGADGMLQFGATYQPSALVPAALMTDWSDDFSSNSLRSAYWRPNPAPGFDKFAVDTSHGDLRVSKPAGSTPGEYVQWYTVDSVWRAVGDFDVTIDFRDAALTRSMDHGNHLGLKCTIGGTDYYVYRSDESGLSEGQNERFGVSPGWWAYGVRYTSQTAGNLRVIRRGSQLSTYLDGELTYQIACGTEPMTCRLELLNNGTPDAISTTFDNFKISATTLEARWNTIDSYAAYAEAKGLSGDDADPQADPDSDGAVNLLEYAAGTDPRMASSAPAPFALGSEGEAPGGPYFTLTARLAKPVPTDISIEAEFSMDMGNVMPWMTAGIGVTDTDRGTFIERTFRAPFIIGYPPSGYMRLKVSKP